MPDNNMIEWLLLTVFILTALSIFINRFLFRRHLKTARKIRGAQIIISVIVLLFHGILFLGVRNILIYIIVSLTVSTVFEFTGIKKGWLFGSYSYSETAGPHILGLPIAVLFMWCSITYMGIWQGKLLITLLFPSSPNTFWILIVTTGLLVTIFDLIADPIAVDEGIWIWGKKGKYAGIPVSNFLSWFIAGCLIVLISLTLSRKPFFQIETRTWVMALPALGYCFISGITSRVCFERKLFVPGVIGLGLATACLAADVYILLSLN